MPANYFSFLNLKLAFYIGFGNSLFMSFLKFLFISLALHIVLFIDTTEVLTVEKTPPVSLLLEQENSLSEKTLNSNSNINQTKQKPFKRAKSSYSDELIKFIQAQAVYPKAALALKQEGSVTISLTLNKEGIITYFELITPSKYGSLTSAALKLAGNLKQYKPFPWIGIETKSFTIPIHYILN